MTLAYYRVQHAMQRISPVLPQWAKWELDK